MTFEELCKLHDEKGSIGIRNMMNSPSSKKFKREIEEFKLQHNLLNKNITQIIFDYKNPDANKNCPVCNKPVSWDYGKGTYKKVCSSVCGNKNRKGSRPEHSLKMKELYASDRGDEVKKILSKKSKEYHASDKGKEDDRRRSDLIKNRIKNGEWTPQITNSWTHWDIEVDGKKFRSSFEAIVFLYFKKNGIMLEYESTRIPYVLEDENKVYITDFSDHDKKIIYEVKPGSLLNNEKNKIKVKALHEWCKENGYTYSIITEKEVKQMTLKIDDNFAKEVAKRYKWNH
jgi:predicted nucleic acid-binding Zn ribbon protein